MQCISKLESEGGSLRKQDEKLCASHTSAQDRVSSSASNAGTWATKLGWNQCWEGESNSSIAGLSLDVDKWPGLMLTLPPGTLASRMIRCLPG